MKIGRKVLPPRGGKSKIPGGIPPLSHKEFDANFTVIISVTVNAVHCHRWGCKEYISGYRKSLQKWLRELYLQYEQHQHEE